MLRDSALREGLALWMGMGGSPALIFLIVYNHVVELSAGRRYTSSLKRPYLETLVL